MSNHVPRLVPRPDARPRSRLRAGLWVASGHPERRRSRWVGQLFQGRCQTPAVAVERSRLRGGRSVERQRLAAHVVAQAWDDRWSRGRAYALGAGDPLLAPKPAYRDRATTPRGRQAWWQAFLQGEDPKAEPVRRGDWVLGDAALRARLDHRAGRPPPRPRGRRPGRSRAEAASRAV